MENETQVITQALEQPKSLTPQERLALLTKQAKTNVLACAVQEDDDEVFFVVSKRDLFDKFAASTSGKSYGVTLTIDGVVHIENAPIRLTCKGGWTGMKTVLDEQ